MIEGVASISTKSASSLTCHIPPNSFRGKAKEAFGVGYLPEIMQYLDEIEIEYETEMSAYSQLRKRSKEVYELTKTFFFISLVVINLIYFFYILVR
ncbi:MULTISPECIES: hypothetical protein [Gammaproteobacteria]|uniref:hypothetical protein n=1 Tax=Gammaproteobacteria TaxID=1236 RepID=UPI0018691339|nr:MULTISPECIES: hypothetical protein [Gammaproteobacteria]